MIARQRSWQSCPGLIEQTLTLDSAIESLAEHFVDKHHALYSSVAACRTRLQWRVRSSSRKFHTSTPRRMPLANSSTDRSHWLTKNMPVDYRCAG